MSKSKIKLAIMASGNGSNAEAIIKYFINHPTIEVSTIYSNNRHAFVLERAKNNSIPAVTFTRKELQDPIFTKQVLQHNYDLIILAGFMWLLPISFIKEYRDRIINIHPALLPKYGGKGMYGNKVHQAVIENKETESGITIHYVNENYDEGNIIFQAHCNVLASDTAATLASRIHDLEHQHYSSVIENICGNII